MIPEQWLITDARIAVDLAAILRRMPRGSGVIVRGSLSAEQWRTIRARGLLAVEEGRGGAVRVHCAREIRRARLARARVLLLSPLYATRTHADWAPLPRMRAAALARLASRPLLALGGMNARRFSRVRRLGFDGWAGIDAWLGGASRE